MTQEQNDAPDNSSTRWNPADFRNQNNLITLTGKDNPRTRNTNCLNLYYQNTRGLRTKLDKLQAGIPTLNFDIYALTETWLTDAINDPELGFFDFNIFRSDRTKQTSHKSDGGGALIAVRKSIAVHQIDTNSSSTESVYVLVKNKSHQFIVGTVYIPCKSSLQTILNFTEELDEVCSKYPHTDIILTGDFNHRNLKWQADLTLDPHTVHTGSSESLYSNLCFYHNLKQHSSILNSDQVQLDLVFSNMKKIKVEESLDRLQILVDDQHPPLSIEISFPVNKRKNNSTGNVEDKTVLCYKQANYFLMSQSLKSVNWNHDLGKAKNVDEATEFFYKILKENIIKFVPSKTIRDFKFPIWATPSLKNLIFEKKKTHKNFKLTSNQSYKIAFQDLRTKCKDKSEQDYREYIQGKEREFKENPEKFWSFIREKKKDESLPLMLHLDNESSNDGTTIANLFAKNFASVYSTEQLAPPEFNFRDSLITPLSNIYIKEGDIQKALKALKNDSSCGPDSIPPVLLKNCSRALVKPLHFLFNESIHAGKYPKIWKTSFVIPIYKKSGSKQDVKNFRAVNKISTIPKILDQLVYKKISPILSPLLAEQQHGFVPMKSTTTNLVSFTDHVNDIIDDGAQFDCILTDYSKAFDKLNLNILCAKLSAYGVNDPLLSWFRDFLSNRSQQVMYKVSKNSKSYYSNPFNVTSGSPQGGHNSGLLFNLYINDIQYTIDIPFWLFADDKKLGKKIVSREDAISLQNVLNKLHEWCEINKMDLNTNKCKVITFHRNRNPILHTYHINNVTLQREVEIKDLGVTLDHKLEFKNHYSNVRNKGMKTLGFVTRNSKEFKNPQTFKLLYFTFVRPVLEYASVVWSPHYEISSKVIESVQRKFLRYLAFKQGHRILDHDYSEILTRNNITTIENRRKMNDITFLCNVLKNKINLPEILAKVNFKTQIRRNRNCNNLLAIKTQKKNYMLNSPINRITRQLNNAIDKDPTIDVFFMTEKQMKDKLQEIFKM